MAWLDSSWAEPAWYPDGLLPFDVRDRGFLLADGVFDTAMVLAGTMVWRNAHLARLFAHCATLHIAVERERVFRAIEAVVQRQPFGSLRITITRGAGSRGLLPSTGGMPTIVATGSPLRPGYAFSPLSLKTASIRRNETSPTSRVKSLAYLDAVFATREADEHQADDALFLNRQGHVACTSSANLFALSRNVLTTPPLRDGVMGGIVRGAIIDIAPCLGLTILEHSLSPTDLQGAELVFATNSLRLLSTVTAFDGVSLSPSSRGAPLVDALIEAIVAETGIDPRHLAGERSHSAGT